MELLGATGAKVSGGFKRMEGAAVGGVLCKAEGGLLKSLERANSDGLILGTWEVGELSHDGDILVINDGEKLGF